MLELEAFKDPLVLRFKEPPQQLQTFFGLILQYLE
jgi:hypothetical protein